MTRVVMRRIWVALALATSVVAMPAGAQMFSDSYEFLKAVKDRDGDLVTKKLSEPGNTLINARDVTDGKTALHVVIERRDLVWVQFLLGKDANPNIKDKTGTTPLQVAIRTGFTDGAEALLKAGADINVTDSTGETPLIAAVHRRDTAQIRMLLENGANPDRSDNSGRTARDYANLAISNKAMLDEFERADASKADKNAAGNYGPSF